MNPVQIAAVLAALASGVGGAIGAQLWDGVGALVVRPLGRARARSAAAHGAAEWAALQQSPADQGRALALAEALVARAQGDVPFRQALEAWWRQATQVVQGGTAVNTITGGTFNGPVVQGRDFTGLTFVSPASESSRSRAPAG
jgi:hypothetical protein